MKRALLFLLPVLLPAGLWGYAYEASFFRAIGLSSHTYLTAFHYTLSGITYLLVMVLPLLVFSQLRKFFTKQIHFDDAKVLEDHLATSKFSEEIKGARLAVALSVVFWLIVYFQKSLPIPRGVSSTFLYVVFVNVMFFYTSIALSPPYSRPTIILALVVSITICFSAGGLGAGKQFLSSRTGLRDDNVVRVERMPSGPPQVTPAPSPSIPSAAGWIKQIIKGLSGAVKPVVAPDPRQPASRASTDG